MLYINVYTWNLKSGSDEPICRSRNGDAEVKERHVGTAGEGKGRANLEIIH